MNYRKGERNNIQRMKGKGNKLYTLTKLMLN